VTQVAAVQAAAAVQAGSSAQTASQGITLPGGKKIKPLPIIVVAAVAVVAIAVAIFGVTQLFGSAAPSIENVGDRVEFGTWRDAPITWRVLAIEDGRALVISEDILAIRQYDDFDFDASSIDQLDQDTFSERDIRVWLNGEFLNVAFAWEEQRAIDLTRLSNPDNSEYGIDGGVDTEDRVFLLSIDEVERYFSDDNDRAANITMTEEDIQYSLRGLWGYSDFYVEETADHLRDEYLGKSKPYWWWLRSPGRYGSPLNTAYISIDGKVSAGIFSGFDAIGIRPALWLNL
jgi:hypothetical protein